MKKLYLSTTMIIIALLGGCAGFAPSISKDHKHTNEDTYLYGRFFMDAKDETLALSGYMTMGFSFDCEDKANYVVGFSRDNPVQVIRIKPSSCTLKELVYTNSDGFVRSRKPAPDGILTNIPFEKNKAYYLGDYFASASTTFSGNSYHYSWRIDSIKNEYEKTTKEMKSIFPALINVDTADRMLANK